MQLIEMFDEQGQSALFGVEMTLLYEDEPYAIMVHVSEEGVPLSDESILFKLDTEDGDELIIAACEPVEDELIIEEVQEYIHSLIEMDA